MRAMREEHASMVLEADGVAYAAGLQSLVLLGAWIVDLASLGTRRDRAAGMLGVGVYALTMGVAFVPTEPLRIGSAPFLSGYPGVVSGALALYGYPLVVMGLAISLVILDVSAHGLTMRWHGHTMQVIS